MRGRRTTNLPVLPRKAKNRRAVRLRPGHHGMANPSLPRRRARGRSRETPRARRRRHRRRPRSSTPSATSEVADRRETTGHALLQDRQYRVPHVYLLHDPVRPRIMFLAQVDPHCHALREGRARICPAYRAGSRGAPRALASPPAPVERSDMIAKGSGEAATRVLFLGPRPPQMLRYLVEYPVPVEPAELPFAVDHPPADDHAMHRLRPGTSHEDVDERERGVPVAARQPRNDPA